MPSQAVEPSAKTGCTMGAWSVCTLVGADVVPRISARWSRSRSSGTWFASSPKCVASSPSAPSACRCSRAARANPGQTRFELPIELLADEISDPNETLTVKIAYLQLGIPSDDEDIEYPVSIVDDTATGTILNTGALPKAYLARFGRTAAVHVADHVEERMAAPRDRGLDAEIGGRQLQPGGEGRLAFQLLSQLAGTRRHGGAQSHHGSGAGFDSSGRLQGGSRGWGNSAGYQNGNTGFPNASAMTGTGGAYGAFQEDGQGLLGQDLLRESSLAFNRRTRNGGTVSFYSRQSGSSFAVRDGGMAIDGDVSTSIFGADYAKGPVVVGLSIAHSRGAGDFDGLSAGAVTSSVTGFYPWLGYRLSERTSVWGVTEYGRGTLSLTAEGNGALGNGMSMAMAAGGLRRELAGSTSGGFGLAFKADALWVGTSFAGVESPMGHLEGAEAAVTRFRTALEGSRQVTIKGRLSLRPSVELGLRRDGGDADEGAGMDVGGGLIVTDPATGISVQVRVRMLVAHQAEGFTEQETSVSVSYNPTPATPLGFAARVAPSWGGDARGGAQALWGGETMTRFGHGAGRQGNQLDADAGYGLPIGRRFVGTPRVGVATSEYGRDYRIGYGLGLLERGQMSLDLGVDALRRERAFRNGIDSTLVGRASIGW